jgi:hypothetical protein
MRGKLISNRKKWGAVCLIILALFSIGMSYSYGGNCEKAFFICLEDAKMLGAAWYLYCFNGYLFCLKYVKR